MAERAAVWLSRSLATLVQDHPGIDLDGDTGAEPPVFDVVIVGSGYGAAVVAERLSKLRHADGSPLSVLVLERGQEYLAGRFPSRWSDLAGHVRFAAGGAEKARGVREGLFDLRVGADASVLVASGVGGGSLINAGVLEPPRPEVLQSSRWPKAVRQDPDFLAAMPALRARLGGHPWQQPPTKSQVLLRLAPAKPPEAWKAVHVSVAQATGANAAGVTLDACIGCGDCFSGCNHNAKDSLDLNLLRLAEQAGARIVSGATVLRLAKVGSADSQPPLWRVFVNHTAGELRRRQKRPFELLARRVVLAAGTLGSTEILMRSQRENLRLSALLGRGFSANGDLIAAVHGLKPEVNAVADEAVAPCERHIGPTITSMIDLRDDATTPMVVQDLAVPAPLRRLYAETFALADTLARLSESDTQDHRRSDLDPVAADPAVLRQSLVVAVMGQDAADGELRLPPAATSPLGSAAGDAEDGLLGVHWPGLRSEQRLVDAQRRLAQLHAAARLGGRVLANPLWRPLGEPLEAVFGAQRGPLLTVHPLGGCCMGEDRHSGVVDDRGRVFDAGASGSASPFHAGLYVVDGAIVPCALGINPALTIAALAARAVDLWLDPMQGETGLRGLGPAQLEPGHAPAAAAADALRRPRFADAPVAQPVAPTMIEVSERMTGRLQLASDAPGTEAHHVRLTLRFVPQSVTLLTSPQPAQRRLTVAHGELVLARKPPDPLTDEFADADIELRVPVLGHALLFAHEPRGTTQRRLRAGVAWVLNRGWRDVMQAARRWLGPRDAVAGPFQIPEYVRGLWRLLSHAGAVRELDYELRLGEAERGLAATAPPTDSFTGQRLHGRKRFTYSCSSNPWQQLSALHLDAFPGLKSDPAAPPVLVFDPRHAAHIGVPLLRVVNQQDRPAALADLASLTLYVARLALTVHGLSFRKPDDPYVTAPQRLSGPVMCGTERLMPEITWLDTWPSRRADRPRVKVRLARYRSSQAAKPEAPPVLLLHGYSASGTTFAHDAIPGHLVGALCRAGRDVWVADLRTSAGLATATEDWTFETVARWDIPLALQRVMDASGQRNVDLVAHCMGAAMLSLALLDPLGVPGWTLKSKLSDHVGRVVFSQIAPVMQLSPANTLRAYLMSYVRYFLPLQDYQFRRDPAQALSNELLDRLLSTLPYPREEFRLENPLWPPGAQTPWAGTRHRMDALYARTFSLANMPAAVLDHIDDFFGPLSVETVSQVIHFARQFSVTTTEGYNFFTAPERLQKGLKFPMLCLHGQDNGLSDPATLGRMAAACVGAGIDHWQLTRDGTSQPHAGKVDEALQLIDQEQARLQGGKAGLMTWRLPGHGHQDCLIGRDAARTNGVIVQFLHRSP